MAPTHKQQVLRKLGLPQTTSMSLEELADVTELPLRALREVYNRGIGAWKTNPQSVRVAGTFAKDPTAPRSARLSKEAWAFARVYSFINKGRTFHTADADIARRYHIE